MAEIEAIIESESVEVKWLDQGQSFSFTLIDQEILWLSIYDENGVLKGAIVNKTDAAIKWATEIFRTYRQRSSSSLPSELKSTLSIPHS